LIGALSPLLLLKQVKKALRNTFMDQIQDLEEMNVKLQFLSHYQNLILFLNKSIAA